MNVTNDPIWNHYPKLKLLAQQFLEEVEMRELQKVLKLLTLRLNDSDDLSCAFMWSVTPQGSHYWALINERVKKCKALSALDSDCILAPQPTPEPSIMDITRRMF